MPDIAVAAQVTGREAGSFTLLASGSSPLLNTADRFLFENDGNTFLLVARGSSASSVTVVTPATVDGLAINDRVVALEQGTYLYGPFPPAQYNDADGKVAISFSAVGSVTIAVIRPAV